MLDDTLDSIFSSDMDPFGKYVAQRAESASTQVESVESTLKSVVEKFNTQALYLSLKSLNRLSDAVHRMEFVVGQQLSTSQSGTKK